jgi:hypothetical protein
MLRSGVLSFVGLECQHDVGLHAPSPPGIFDKNIKAKGLANSLAQEYETKGFAGATWQGNGASLADTRKRAMRAHITDYRLSQRNILCT